MQITIDTVIAFLSLMLGGGGGAFFTWRWQRAKAKAEAKTAEVDATKEMQEVYQQSLPRDGETSPSTSVAVAPISVE